MSHILPDDDFPEGPEDLGEGSDHSSEPDIDWDALRLMSRGEMPYAQAARYLRYIEQYPHWAEAMDIVDRQGWAHASIGLRAPQALDESTAPPIDHELLQAYARDPDALAPAQRTHMYRMLNSYQSWRQALKKLRFGK